MRYLIVIIFLITAHVSHSQNSYPSSGAVILTQDGGQLKLTGGTIDAGLWTYSGRLYLADWNTAANGLNINLSDGRIGIGTQTPSGKLDINAGSQYAIRTNTTSRYVIEVKNSNDVGGGWWLVNDPGGSFAIHENGIGDQFTVKEGGNVGIGTITPDSKLTVKGTIHSQEIKVDLNGSVAPDYVFEKDYPLASLQELKSFIDQHKHLPEIPSAKQMKEEGINLKEMNLLLLKKIEELTLYNIELHSELRNEKTRNESQDRELRELKAMINKLKNTKK